MQWYGDTATGVTGSCCAASPCSWALQHRMATALPSNPDPPKYWQPYLQHPLSYCAQHFPGLSKGTKRLPNRPVATSADTHRATTYSHYPYDRFSSCSYWLLQPNQNLRLLPTARNSLPKCSVAQLTTKRKHKIHIKPQTNCILVWW